MTISKVILGSLIAALILVAVAIVGFYELFSNFRAYDDEGLFMLSNRLFLSGYIPYTDITWLFGPVQLAVVQLLHDGLGIPIDHSAVRFITLVQWLILCSVAGLLVSVLAHSIRWGMVSFVLTFLYTTSIVNEPGHPQILVTAFSLAIALFPALWLVRRSWIVWLLVGATVALVFYIKVNAGVFCLAAVAIALLAQWFPGRWRVPLMTLLVLGSVAFPFLLMAPLLTVDHCFRYALVSGLSMMGVALLAVARPVPGLNFYPSLLASASGFLLLSVAALGYAVWQLVSPSDIVVSLWGYAADQVAFYHFFRDYSGLQLLLAGVATGCALLQLVAPKSALARISLCPARLLFVCAAFYSLLVNTAGNSQFMLGYAGPWCWLIILGPTRGLADMTGRLLLAALAAWTPLLAYPMPGTQLYLGSLPILLAASVCAADGLVILQMKYQTAEGRYSLVGIGSGAALLMALAALLLQYQSIVQQYASYQPLALPGTGPLRIEKVRAQQYRKLVAQADLSDVLLTTFRFNSLYFWSTARSPGPGYLSQWPLLLSSPAAQAQARQGLQSATRPLVIDRQRRGADSGAESWLQQDFPIYHRIGSYVLMRRPVESLP
jgi:hypothetical protein